MTGGLEGPRPTKVNAKAVNPKSPAAFFAAQGQSVQKSAKSEPGIKQRSVSGDVGSNVQLHLLSPKLSVDDITMIGSSPKSKPSTCVPASPKRAGSSGLKLQAKTSSGSVTPTTGRSQVINF